MKKDALTKILLAEIKAEGLPAPVLEHRFHEIRKWRLDICWPDFKLGLEIHGAVYAQGRHTRGKGFENDREKMNEAIVRGWRILEYSTGQVKQGIPLLDLKRLFEDGRQQLDDDDMCPNCVTPWKCNGPHLLNLTRRVG